MDISAGRSKKNVQKQIPERECWTCQSEEARKMSKTKLRSVKTGPANQKKQEKCPKPSPGARKLDLPAGRNKNNVQNQVPEQEIRTCVGPAGWYK